MQFEKKLVYLGDRTMTFKDGGEMHTLSFFDVDAQDSVDINVMSTNAAIMSQVRSLSFGTSCCATIGLRDAKDKNTYKLSLVGLSPVKG